MILRDLINLPQNLSVISEDFEEEEKEEDLSH